MRLSKSTLPGIPSWLLLVFFFAILKWLRFIDIFNLFTKRRGRLEETLEEDRRRERHSKGEDEKKQVGQNLLEDRIGEGQYTRWYHCITPEMFFFTINSLFLNRTKASLRLSYEPLFDREESMSRAIAWYRDRLEL